MSSPNKKGGEKAASDDDNQDFLNYMQEAQQTDLTAIERTGCLSVGRDLKNNPLIIMIPSMALNISDKPETMFRKMLLLFLVKANEMVGTAYSVVYAHTTYDVMSQYPLIYRFYSILPRSYKKNIQKMYIIHPNVGIRMFFEFARIFLSQKFYNKLSQYESILDFQRVIPPTLVHLPLKFLRKEDEDRGLKYYNRMPSLTIAYDASIGTTKCLEVCMEYLRHHQGIRKTGIFRIPGDEGELQLAKIRLQYAFQTSSKPRICLSENKQFVIIGDVENLYGGSSATNSTESAATVASTPSSSLGNKKASSGKLSAVENAVSNQLPEEVPMSVVAMNNIHTVAQVLKMSIRDLPEALVPEPIFAEIVDLTRRYDIRQLSSDWEAAVAVKLAAMPLEHLSTFVHIILFLREVSSFTAENSMDAHNLSIVFAPTIFRSEVTDPIRAVMEVKLSQVLLEQILVRHNLLYHTIQLFIEQYSNNKLFQRYHANTARQSTRSMASNLSTDGMLQVILSNPILTNYPLNAEETSNSRFQEFSGADLADITDITLNMNSKMMDRLGGGRGGRTSVRLDTAERSTLGSVDSEREGTEEYSEEKRPSPTIPVQADLADAASTQDDVAADAAPLPSQP